ncbi:unnamed protein product [Acanthoscelides obtectus]|uniref:Uncharacterized protein n=1 Tax=Acanthoscelides obtectus TaxID=200917 RepID=A0A9P0Q200_ACAOB|nr:unnamed protein product [Acanthoscelides obtectus]CAH2004183.1 unnamed protein product [Acanthoscelides obtectus]CAK1625135.1 hypothetical protein AOBTE_LOCUS2980 [Acanthoscelides obtectus]CAK1625139.1 hypothetical protein AOBTE_LOCUS2983 [Acanthoscelides obtectus]
MVRSCYVCKINSSNPESANLSFHRFLTSLYEYISISSSMIQFKDVLGVVHQVQKYPHTQSSCNLSKRDFAMI